METVSYKLQGSDLHLVGMCVPKPAVAAERPPVPTHHVLVLDCSGSMTDSHPAMRKALSEKLYTLVSEVDVVSVIWFSGRGEHGVVVERASLPTLREVQKMQKLFERWIRPVGLTGFKEPLNDVSALLKSKKSGERTSLFFLSDGCDNQWAREEIYAAIGELASHLDAATIVEYGYYADRTLLSKMAERCGGTLVFATDFAEYEPVFSDAISQASAMVGASTQVEVSAPIFGVLFSVDQDLLRVFTYGADAFGQAMVHQRALEGDGVWYLTKTPPSGAQSKSSGSLSDTGRIAALYAALSVYATRMAPEAILPILRELGDVHFIRRYGTLFGKQAYTDFMRDAASASFYATSRLVDGFDRGAVPSDDAFTVLDLLSLLCSDESCRVLLDSEHFRYSRISRKRLDATEGEQLRFEGYKSETGYPIQGLVWNEDRANISMRVQRHGYVDLTGRLPFSGKVPTKFETFQWRNYALVKDGLINVSKLPVLMPEKMLADLRDHLHEDSDFTVLAAEDGMVSVVLKLDRMPVLNRSQVDRASAKKLFERCAKLEELRAKNKVFKTYVEERRSAAWDERYGKEASDWLRSQGLTEWGGYAPASTKQVAASDYYLAKVLEVKIKGWSSLPSVKDVTSGKSKSGPAQAMKSAVDEVEAAKARLGNGFGAWVSAQQRSIEIECRALGREISSLKFAVIVSGTWFTEFGSIEDRAVLPVEIAGKVVDAEAVMSEEKVLL